MMRVVAAVARRPTLWPTAIRQWRRSVAPGWWRRRPFVPLPDREYLRFRMVTQYGNETDGALRPDDVLNYLAWCRTWQRELR